MRRRWLIGLCLQPPDVDRDCWRSLDVLWQPPVTYPYVAKFTTPGPLKTQANYTQLACHRQSEDQHVWREVGAALMVAGPAQHTNDEWLPAQLVKPEGAVHGRCLAMNLTLDA